MSKQGNIVCDLHRDIAAALHVSASQHLENLTQQYGTCCVVPTLRVLQVILVLTEKQL